MKKHIRLIISLSLLLLVFIAAILVKLNVCTSIDEEVMHFFISYRGEKEGFKYYFLRTITEFASTITITTFLVMFTIANKFNRKSILFVVTVLSAILLMYMLKIIVRRPRHPQEYMWVLETSYSFPSGHSTSSAVLCASLIYFINTLNIKNWIKNIITYFLVFLLIMIPLTRLLLGVHYLSDVIIGMIIGFAFTNLYIYLDNSNI